MLRPYTCRVGGPIENHHPMDVVGHHDEGIQGDAGVVPRNLNPAVPGNPTSCTEPHLGSADLPEQVFTVPHADGNEIRAGPGVIEPRQPERSPPWETRSGTRST